MQVGQIVFIAFKLFPILAPNSIKLFGLNNNLLKISENNLPKAGSIIDLVRGLVVRVEGEVSNPGEYLLAGSYKLKDVFDVSGGVSNGADTSKISIVEPSSSDDGSIRLSTSLLDSNEKKKIRS